ncbi:trans-sulfuration enzyme family protein [Vulgatibacter incomptus]|uniref:Methionine gamma-lyase n=1 Tax=Vulgatibacter incomptus TaxID=1391653 RepID=A0A0K1PGH5_9BACT|nr:PLP-dependent transferase [Vulgatibacter incomptus]AKU92521.1 Methionine gamma-lyase [Vulgatibacter incomptus]
MRHSFDTLAIHAGREDLPELGVHALPLDLSTTNPMSDPEQGGESLGSMAMGAKPGDGGSVYARLHNPTVARFESALARLEGAEESVAFGSGMAALTALLMAAKQRGGHMVAVRPMYGSADHLIASGLLGMEVSWSAPDEISSHIRPDTSLIYVETPANPTLKLLDVEAVVKQAKGIPVAVDATFATPVLLRPIAHGATLVLHSATKFLGGHGDVIAGVIATNGEWATLLRQMRVVTGALLHPLGGYLLHRGLSTLPIRVRAAQEVARILAKRLAEHPAIEKVFYPELPGCDPEGLVGRQMKGPGSLLSFEMKGGYPAACELLRSVKLATPAVSLGSVDTLIQHPASMTHRVVAPEAKLAAGITDSLVRLSVGLEDPEDLWADLAGALDRAAAAR